MKNTTRKNRSRFITIFIPDTVSTKSVFKLINPILKKYKSTKNKCISAGKYGNFSESEHKFSSISIAKSAIKDSTNILKEEHKFNVGKSMDKIIFTVMPTDYEKTGSRGIIRPDYHQDKNITYKKCKN